MDIYREKNNRKNILFGQKKLIANNVLVLELNDMGIFKKKIIYKKMI